jgi:hypothetical protein
MNELDPKKLLMKPLTAPADITALAWTERKATLARALRARLITLRRCVASQLADVPDDAVIRAYATAARSLGSPSSEPSLLRFVRDARDADEFRFLLVRPPISFDLHDGDGMRVPGSDWGRRGVS